MNEKFLISGEFVSLEQSFSLFFCDSPFLVKITEKSVINAKKSALYQKQESIHNKDIKKKEVSFYEKK